MTTSRAYPFPILADEALLRSARSSYRIIGAILLDAGLLTPPQVEKICRLQAESGELFGSIALRLELLSQDELEDALDQQFGVARVRTSNSAVSLDVRAAFDPVADALQPVRELATILAARSLRTQGCARSVSVLAASRCQGCSLLTANLAVVLAQMDYRVLLIDAHFQAPRLHALFGVENRSGLSNVLCGLSPAVAFRPVPGLGALTLLPSGVCPPGAYSLTLRDAFRHFLSEVAASFDVMLIDPGPLGPAGGAQALLAVASGALLLVSTNVTTVEELAACHRQLGLLDCELVGHVLNSR